MKLEARMRTKTNKMMELSDILKCRDELLFCCCFSGF